VCGVRVGLTARQATGGGSIRILQLHNFYQHPGGEDAVVADEAALLERHGHEVIRYTRHNDDVDAMPKLRVGAGTVWSRASARAVAGLCRAHRPHVVHVHNTLPLLSPSVYYAARAGGAAVVQTLHNYRLMCPQGLMVRDGRVCEQCVGKLVKWPAVRHACYRDSRAGSAAIAAMLTVHGVARTYQREVDAYIACSEFLRDKVVADGLPADRVHFKPNFVGTEPEPGDGSGGYVLFLGRLSEEKGVGALLNAWASLHDVPLKIIGSGPLTDHVSASAAQNPAVEYRGWVSFDGVVEALRGAAALIVPSLTYEGFPRVIVEALACGTPVLASRIGAMADVIEPGVTGDHFEPGDPASLAAVVGRRARDAAGLRAMRANARGVFDRLYAGQSNYRQLIDIYRRAIAHRSARGGGATTLDPLAEEDVAPCSPPC